MFTPNLKVWLPFDQDRLSMYWKRFWYAPCGQQKSAPMYAFGNSCPGCVDSVGVSDSSRCQTNRASFTTCGVTVETIPTLSTLSWVTELTNPVVGSVFGPVCTSSFAAVSRWRL